MLKIVNFRIGQIKIWNSLFAQLILTNRKNEGAHKGMVCFFYDKHSVHKVSHCNCEGFSIEEAEKWFSFVMAML